MHLVAVGLNHRSAPLALRSRLALSLDELTPTLNSLERRPRRLSREHPEVALLSTCNRSELYCAGAEPLAEQAVDWLAGIGGIERGELLRHAYVLEGPAVARHAFRVASGLDSMVIGETQILGQMKRAVREADSAGTLGPALHQLFQRAFAVAKDVRSSTDIGGHSMSLAAACVQLAARHGGDLARSRVLLIGAGEMIEGVAIALASRGAGAVSIANRSFERGAQLAARVGAQPMRLADVAWRLPEFDAVVSCTASPCTLLDAADVQAAMAGRAERPLLLIDLAVPRDIDPAAAAIDGVRLHAIDDLAAIVAGAGERRLAAAEDAAPIVDAGVAAYARWLEQRASVPLIRAITAQAEDWSALELARARRLLAKGQDVDSVLEALCKGLSQKMLHGALTELGSSAGAQRHQLASTVSRLFLRCPTERAAALDDGVPAVIEEPPRAAAAPALR